VVGIEPISDFFGCLIIFCFGDLLAIAFDDRFIARFNGKISRL